MIRFFLRLVVVFFIPYAGVAQTIPTLDSLLEFRWNAEGQNFTSTLLVNDGLVFETFGLDYAIAAQTGQRLYFDDIKDQKIIRKYTKDSIIYFSSKRGGNAIVNIYTGQIIYRNKAWIKKPVIKKPLIITGPCAYLTLNDTTFAAISVKDGSVEWQKSMNKLYNTTKIIGSEIYVLDQTILYKLNRNNGRTIETYDFGDPGMDFIIENEIIYYFINDKGLIKYNLTDKLLLWEYGDFDQFYKIHEIINERDKLFIVDQNLTSISKFDGTLIWKNNSVGAGMNVYIGASKKYIFTYQVSDDYVVLVACKKKTGELAYKSFANHITDKALDEQLWKELETYGSFSFAKDMHEDLIYVVSNTGKIYCFKVKE